MSRVFRVPQPDSGGLRAGERRPAFRQRSRTIRTSVRTVRASIGGVTVRLSQIPCKPRIHLLRSPRFHSLGETVKMYKVTLIPGDGVGPEIAEATRKCVEATGVKIDWDVQDCGIEVIQAEGKVPERVLKSIKANKVALKAPITTPIGKGFRSVNVYLRQELNLFACVRPCKLYKGVRTYFSGSKVDLVLVRENTEDLYAGVEFKAGEPATEQLIGDINRLATGKKISTGVKTTGVSIKPISYEGTRQDRRLRVRLRREARPQIGDVGLQGEHHEVHRRPVVRRDAGRRFGLRCQI